jgi:hypothetical protein
MMIAGLLVPTLDIVIRMAYPNLTLRGGLRKDKVLVRTVALPKRKLWQTLKITHGLM